MTANYRKTLISGGGSLGGYSPAYSAAQVAGLIPSPLIAFQRIQEHVYRDGHGFPSPEVVSLPSCSFESVEISWTSSNADSCTLLTSPQLPGIHGTVAQSATKTVPGRVAVGTQFSLHCGRGSQSTRSSVIVNISSDPQFRTSARPMMSAAFGSGAQENVGISAKNDTEIAAHLARACRNLGYTKATAYGLYNTGFSSPGNNNNCWISANVTPAGAWRIGTSDIVCKNAKANGNPRYIGSFNCVCQ